MKLSTYSQFLVLVCLIWVASVWSCAGRSYIMVDYQVPVATQQLHGKTIQLQVEDQRENKVVMSQNAAYKFKDFEDRYSLAWITPEKVRILAGMHSISALFKEALEKRLKTMGAEITDHNNSQVPVLSIAVESFTIDLKDHKWMADVGYLASLSKEGHPVFKERIRGNAERIKVIGRKGADVVVSEIFTDAVNRLDVQKLFQKAGLIP